MFAGARDAAGTGRVELADGTVGQIIDEACDRYGADFAAVVRTSRIWVNGEPAERDVPVGAEDEVAVLPPVSGG